MRFRYLRAQTPTLQSRATHISNYSKRCVWTSHASIYLFRTNHSPNIHTYIHINPRPLPNPPPPPPNSPRHWLRASAPPRNRKRQHLQPPRSHRPLRHLPPGPCSAPPRIGLQSPAPSHPPPPRERLARDLEAKTTLNHALHIANPGGGGGRQGEDGRLGPTSRAMCRGGRAMAGWWCVFAHLAFATCAQESSIII